VGFELADLGRSVLRPTRVDERFALVCEAGATSAKNVGWVPGLPGGRDW
jgi:hypothetical protein